tara:strand:+ start:539 stop:1786 length:1248 start_codon:yes stop_codon:yes gene_type:complete
MHGGDDYFDQFYNMEPYLEINEEQWETIKDMYPKDEVKEKLADLCMTYPLPYQTEKYSEDDCRKDYFKLKGIRWNELLIEGKQWFPRKGRESKYPLTYEGKHLLFKRYNVGNLSSNWWQEQNRWSICSSGYPGPARTWRTRAFMISLMGAAFSLKLDKIGKNELRLMISLRKYIASQHKPNVTKTLTEYLGSKTILDFSMGWGDRLAGAFSSETVEHYVGIDPRKENHPIYEQQRDFYTKHTSFFEKPTKTNFHQAAAEDFDYSEYNDYFDLVFTSPPYFNVERYGHDDNQSWVRYKSIDAWNEHFLHKALEKIIPTLKKGGKMAINIADVFTSGGGGGKDWKEITNPMGDFLISKGLTYKGCIGMEMAKRPNSGGAGTVKKTEHNEKQYSEEVLKLSEETVDKTFCEPIWIFEK